MSATTCDSPLLEMSKTYLLPNLLSCYERCFQNRDCAHIIWSSSDTGCFYKNGNYDKSFFKYHAAGFCQLIGKKEEIIS